MKLTWLVLTVGCFIFASGVLSKTGTEEFALGTPGPVPFPANNPYSKAKEDLVPRPARGAMIRIAVTAMAERFQSAIPKKLSPVTLRAFTTWVTLNICSGMVAVRL